MSGLTLLLALLAPAASIEDAVAIEGENAVSVAEWMCSSNDEALWQEPTPNDEYVRDVRSYWAAAFSEASIGPHLDFDEMVSDSGERMGIYRQRTVTPGHSVQTRSCTMHFGQLAHAITTEDISEFTQAEPREHMIGTFANEETWESTMPGDSDWDFVRVSLFSSVSDSAQHGIAPHPFRGTYIKFLKIDLEQ